MTKKSANPKFRGKKSKNAKAKKGKNYRQIDLATRVLWPDSRQIGWAHQAATAQFISITLRMMVLSLAPLTAPNILEKLNNIRLFGYIVIL